MQAASMSRIYDFRANLVRRSMWYFSGTSQSVYHFYQSKVRTGITVLFMRVGTSYYDVGEGYDCSTTLPVVLSSRSDIENNVVLVPVLHTYLSQS